MMIDGRIVLAAAIVFAVLVGGWMFRYGSLRSSASEPYHGCHL